MNASLAAHVPNEPQDQHRYIQVNMCDAYVSKTSADMMNASLAARVLNEPQDQHICIQVNTCDTYVSYSANRRINTDASEYTHIMLTFLMHL